MKWIQKAKSSIRSKLILLLGCMIVLPLAIAGILLFTVQQHITESFVTQSLMSKNMQLADLIDQEVKIVNRMSNLYYLDSELTHVLQSMKGTEQTEALEKLCSKYTSAIGKIHTEVSLFPYTPSESLPSNTAPTSIPTRTGSGNTYWFSPFDLSDSISHPSHVYASRLLHNRSTWEPIGTLLISIQESELRKVYSGYLTESQNAYLIDRSGKILSSISNQHTDYLPDFSRCTLYYGSYLDNTADAPQYVTYHTISTNAWMLVIVSDYAAIWHPYRAFTQSFLIGLLFYFLIAVFLSIFFADRFVRPIRQLCDNIELVKRGNLDTMVPVTSSDEIGHLSEQYNNMLIRIKELLHNIVSEQDSRHNAEIQALQAQINPHFIYNSLASIRFLIFAQKNQEADLALLSLINILRGTLSNPQALSTVSQEIKLLKDYILLQQLSFSGPLTVEYDLDESINHCAICKLTLQPIVENAFIHGFDAKQDDCRLSIRTKNCGSFAEIIITDNGNGFDIQSAKQKAWGEVDSPHNGLGIRNVHQRLVLNFGSAYGLRLESTPNVGTTAHILIPKKEKESDIFIYDNRNC